MNEKQIKSGQLMLVIGGIIITLTQMSIPGNCFSLFIVPICEDLGLIRGQFTFAQSCLSLGGVIGAMYSAKVFSKLGIVGAMRISAILVSALFFLESFANTVPMFCIINVLIGFVNVFGTSMPLSLLISEWYAQKRNTVTGIVMMGSGLGTSIFNSLGSELILMFGWRMAYKILTLIMLVFALGVDVLLLKEAPESVKASTVNKASAGKSGERVIPNFYNTRNVSVGLMCLMMSIGAGIFTGTIQPHLRDIGYSQTYAANVYSMGMLAMAVGKIFHGIIIDKFGIRVSNTLICLTASFGLAGVLNYKGSLQTLQICVGMLFITSLGVVAIPAICEALGGIENKKFFLGKLTVFTNIGYMAAPIIHGTIYDKIGTYTPLYYFAIGVFAVSLIFIWTLLPKNETK